MNATSGVVRRTDEFARATVAGAAEWLTARRQRGITHTRNTFVHRVPNGHRDPLSFWHVVDALLNIDPLLEFSSKQLADWLNQHRPEFIWDAVTVGRILADIAESCELANGQALDNTALLVRKTSSGTWYQTTNETAGYRVLLNLLEDLEKLGEQWLTAETRGTLPKRYDSPLLDCPSVAVA
jgi:hypothetical protein